MKKRLTNSERLDAIEEALEKILTEMRLRLIAYFAGRA